MPVALAKLRNEQFVPLIGGAYTARSLIANAQRCVNLFPEKNQADSETPVTHYLTPGLTFLNACPDGPNPARGLYFASNNELFYVAGPNVYFVDDQWLMHKLGTIPLATTPVSMVDDDTEILLVDGSQYGYSINLQTHAFARIIDPNFLGADRCDFLDTFIVSNVPGTQEFQSTLPNVFQWDPLYFASKTAFSDDLVTIIVMHREIWLIGATTTEIWYNAGNAAFPFAILPGTFVEHGCAAKYSICKHDLNVFWLSRDKDGVGMALVGKDYRVQRISTHAMETAWGKYPTISDAVAYTYLQEGHIFWCINFPSGDATWVYDLQTGAWHERVFTDPNDGLEHRHLAQCASLGYGNVNVCADWQNGNLYKFDLQNGTDNCVPIVRRRGFPHLLNSGNRVHYAAFKADMQAGEPPQDEQCQPKELTAKFLAQLWVPGSSCEVMQWPLGANGNVAPTINIQGSLTDLTGPQGDNNSFTYAVDIDQAGYQYALTEWAIASPVGFQYAVTVYPPGTTGNAAPLRRFIPNELLDIYTFAELAFAGLCVDTSGNIFIGIMDQSANKCFIYKYPASSSGAVSGTLFLTLPFANPGITSLYFDVVRQWIWVTVAALHAGTPGALAFDLTGAQQANLGATSLLTPTQVCVDPTGNIWVADTVPLVGVHGNVFMFNSPTAANPSRTLSVTDNSFDVSNLGVAVDTNGLIYISMGNTGVSSGTGRIRSYPANSNGNVTGTQLTQITGAATFLANMISGAVTYPTGVKIPVQLVDSGIVVGPSTQATLDKAKVYLRCSDDRGRTFGNPIGQSLGTVGQYLKQPQWRRLGMARDRVFELFWSGPQLTALNGAWVDALPMSS